MCPGCGAIRGRCLQTGYDDLDRVIRQRECRTCDLRYATIEVAVPGASFFRLADTWRWRNLYRARLARGYHNTKQGKYRRSRQWVEVKVRLHG